MSNQTRTPTLAQGAPWHDPIVQELHDIRAQLVEKYNGDMSAYSQAATAHALALGFRFGLKEPGPHDSEAQGVVTQTEMAKRGNLVNPAG